jgi:hypothetical protein
MLPTPTASAELLLKLYELRRESVLREARTWFAMEFNPSTFEEFVALSSGEHSAWFRMVVSYWDMAASFVAFGAIDPRMFQAANEEILVVFAKVEPFLAQMREQRNQPDALKHLAGVTQQFPNAESQLHRFREYFRGLANKSEAV